MGVVRGSRLAGRSGRDGSAAARTRSQTGRMTAAIPDALRTEVTDVLRATASSWRASGVVDEVRGLRLLRPVMR